jgi:hypothetical protein
MRSFVKAWAYNVFVALSQLGSAILFGDPDESISGRIGKGLRTRAWWAQPFRLVPPFARHCLASIEDDEGANSASKRREFV